MVELTQIQTNDFQQISSLFYSNIIKYSLNGVCNIHDVIHM